MPYLTPAALAADLAVRDLTDPAAGPHAIQLIVDAVLNATAARRPELPLVVYRGERIVEVADNYDRLGYSPGAAARDGRYSRYVSADRMLRSQTSALIPGALRTLTTRHPAARPSPTDPATPNPTAERTPADPNAATRQTPTNRDAPHPATSRTPTDPDAPHPAARRTPAGPDVLVACPGIVYRRDAIDRLHTGTPHQLDLWRISSGPVAVEDLIELVAVAVSAALPGTPWRTRPATHPYTTDGLEIQAWSGADWVEIGECGLAAAHVTPRGLALGLGLDRLLMLRKGIADIRLLRSADPRVAGQMTTLAPYAPVPAQPAARRDLSVAMPPGVTAEDLGDRVRDLLGPDAHLVEEVTIRSVTPAAGLPAASRARLGIRDDEVNVLLRIILRDPHATLPGTRANELRDRIWTGLTAGRPAPHPAAA